MLDLIGTTVLTAVIAVNLNAAIVTMPLSATEKLTTVTIAGLWIGFAIALANYRRLCLARDAARRRHRGGKLRPCGRCGVWLSPRARAALMDIPVPLVIGLNAAPHCAGRLHGAAGRARAAQWTVSAICWMGRRHGRRDRDPIDDRHGEEFVPPPRCGAGMERAGYARSDLGRRAGPTLRAWVLATDFWRFDRPVAITSLPWSNIPTLIVPFYLIMPASSLSALRARGRSASWIVVAVQLPVDNGNSGDIAPLRRCAVAARSRLNRVILRRWETIASVSGSSSRLPRRAAAPDQNTAGR